MKSVGVEGLAGDDGLVGIELSGGIGGLRQFGAVGKLDERHGFAAVDGVGDDGVFDEAKVDAYLMGAAGFRF